MAAVKKWFSRHRNPNRPEKELLQLLEINLTRNDFEFNSEFYLQVRGTAMGKIFAPSYANIFMAYWEETALQNCRLKPLHYYRFLDDIWGVWTHSREEFDTFIHTLNTHHPSITVKFEIDGSLINFLDTVTYKGPNFGLTGKLDIKVYFKTTDSHALLHKSSFHPKHTFRGIVKSQLLRFHRISTRREDFMEATKILFSALRQRGYSRSFLRNSLKKFQISKLRDDKTVLPLVSTYSSLSMQLNSKIKRNFDQCTAGTSVFQKHRVISAYRRNKNLKDLLVQSKLQGSQKVPLKSMCVEFEPKLWVRGRTGNRVYKIWPTLSPKTTNCVYLIYCSRCSLQYVGETRNSVQTRLIQHRYNLRRKKDTNTHIVRHFLSHPHCLRIMVLQNHPNWTHRQRRICERYWIDRLGTRYPGGLNER